jgi:predicted PurR-regulated permease PerM
MSADPNGTIIDMTPDGQFRDPAPPPRSIRASGWAALAVIVGGALLGLVLALWLAITVLPVVFAALIIAYLVTRLRAWTRRRGGPIAPMTTFRWR